MLRRSAKIGAMMRFMGWGIALHGGAVRALVLHPSDGGVVPGDGTMDEGLAQGKGFSAEPSLCVELKRSAITGLASVAGPVWI